jgi:hypothetical protein
MASELGEIIFYPQSQQDKYREIYYTFGMIKPDYENRVINLQVNAIKPERNDFGVYTAEDFKNQRGRQIVEIVMQHSVKNLKLRSELKRLIYAIIDDDELLDFFITMSPPLKEGYIFWNCPQMSKIRKLFTSDDETMYTFSFKCRALKKFFSNTSQFYNEFYC